MFVLENLKCKLILLFEQNEINTFNQLMYLVTFSFIFLLRVKDNKEIIKRTKMSDQNLPA